jgi:hypothetical protein
MPKARKFGRQSSEVRFQISAWRLRPIAATAHQRSDVRTIYNLAIQRFNVSTSAQLDFSAEFLFQFG